MAPNYKGVILVGGPQKGTRFRPLSLDCPKPLFPIAGYATIEHHVEKLSQVPGLKEILLIGFYQPSEQFNDFIAEAHANYGVNIRYLQEFASLGTAGGIYHFRDQILKGNPSGIFILNADVCGDLPLKEMVDSLNERKTACCVILSTEATREQSVNYGCLVVDRETAEVLHYVEKPTTFVSTMVNCGVYLFTADIFHYLTNAFQQKLSQSATEMYDSGEQPETLWFEKDIFPKLAACKVFYSYHTTKWWSQLKSAAAAIYANRHCLALYRQTHPERLSSNDEFKNVVGDVYVHPTARVHPTAVLGPNVSIGKHVVVGAGVRIKESIILPGVVLQDHCCILYSIVGWNSTVGMWARVEGTPIGPNPNMPFAKLESKPLFNSDGRLNPNITILGSKVQIPGEVVILNSIVLPHKELGSSYKNQIIL